MKKSLIFSFSLLGQIGFATAIPIVVLGLIGRLLDQKLETGPYLFLAGIALSLPIVYLTIRKIAKQALEKMNG